MTLKEVSREIAAYYYRYQLEQSNFREIAYIIMLSNKDPKKPTVAKSKFWPIPEVDKYAKDDKQNWAKTAQALLDYHNKKRQNG